MIINLTWHDVTVRQTDGKYKTITPSGTIRLSYSLIELEPIEWIRVTKSYYGWWVALPKPEKDIVYIVSRVVCELHTDRPDFYIVNEKQTVWWKTRVNSLSPNPYYKWDE